MERDPRGSSGGQTHHGWVTDAEVCRCVSVALAEVSVSAGGEVQLLMCSTEPPVLLALVVSRWTVSSFTAVRKKC